MEATTVSGLPRRFLSFIQAGFECSTHRLANGARLDPVAATRHDEFVVQDYERLRGLGIRTVREGVRWTLIQREAGRLDFSTVLPFLQAARQTGIEIIWDLFHFGWPDFLDIFEPSWVDAFESLATHFARLVRTEFDGPSFVAPVNEISFMAWGGGDVACINPFQRGRGYELKRQLVRGFLAAARAVRSELPDATIVSPEPMIHVAGRADVEGDAEEAERYRMSMFEAWDMILGRRDQDLGGSKDAVELLGVNYYDHNQRWTCGMPLSREDTEYRPFREILHEVWQRYRLPVLVTETGTEREARPEWFAYMSEEVRAAEASGVPVQGLCLYPVLNHPGWDDGRHCHNGLWDYADDAGSRAIYGPLAREIQKQHQFRGEGVQFMNENGSTNDVVCFSHLRWGFVFQRPQHLMSRFARRGRVFFVEEAIHEDRSKAEMRLHVCPVSGVTIAVPLLPREMNRAQSVTQVSLLVSELFSQQQIHHFVAWYYTPMALEYSVGLSPAAVVYDCMDELSLFRHAPPELAAQERRLFQIADLVFTGGVSLFEAKQREHPRVYPFPSSVDYGHFVQARRLEDMAVDQKHLPRPRAGYAGVIDERIDLDLLRDIAAERPDWHFMMLGPVVKIDPATLPQLPNIHWLGMKKYEELPLYFAGWDVGMMPFALNESTRFISPTKTPEYLAAGLPVVSTPIRDVERQYGKSGLVRIARSAGDFLRAMDEIAADDLKLERRESADAYLATMSWDRTWNQMNKLIEEVRADSEAAAA